MHEVRQEVTVKRMVQRTARETAYGTADDEEMQEMVRGETVHETL